MAHFAKLGIGNIVEQVVVVSNDIAITEQAGIEFLRNLYKDSNAQWIQTSYNRNFRKNFAGVGSFYDMYKDVFINIKPYNSWVLNEKTCEWEAPIPMPTDGQRYTWDESTKNWILIPATV
jgi:hypothetical protein